MSPSRHPDKMKIAADSLQPTAHSQKTRSGLEPRSERLFQGRGAKVSNCQFGRDVWRGTSVCRARWKRARLTDKGNILRLGGVPMVEGTWNAIRVNYGGFEP